MEILVHNPKYDEEKELLFFNKEDSLPVPRELWEFEIGSYKAIAQVLRAHQGKPLDMEYFSRVLDFIRMTIEQVEKISSIDLLT